MIRYEVADFDEFAKILDQRVESCRNLASIAKNITISRKYENEAKVWEEASIIARRTILGKTTYNRDPNKAPHMANNTVWMNLNGNRVRVPKEEADTYVANGYSFGLKVA